MDYNNGMQQDVSAAILLPKLVEGQVSLFLGRYHPRVKPGRERSTLGSGLID